MNLGMRTENLYESKASLVVASGAGNAEKGIGQGASLFLGLGRFFFGF